MNARPQKLVPRIVMLSPTSVETWQRCERRYLLRHVLGIPASDAGLSNDEGLRLHAVLRFIHEQLGCGDSSYVQGVLADHDCDTDAMRSMLERHRQRCPSVRAGGDDAPATVRGHHEVERARYHHREAPMFMASARLDAVWLHDGIFDIRDYKSGSQSQLDLADDPRAWVQAWVYAPRAEHLGLRLRIRYEYLSPEVRDDPEPWEPDTDDLVAVEERLRRIVLAVHDSDFPGVDDAEVCGRCPYRSVCSESASPGVPTWPSLAVDLEADLDADLDA